MRTLSVDTAGTKETLIERVLSMRAQAPERPTEVWPGLNKDSEVLLFMLHTRARLSYDVLTTTVSGGAG